MPGEHRQPGRGRVPAVQEEVDHGRVDLPATTGRQQVRRELTDLLVGERVVRGLALGLLEQEAGGDRGREVVGERVVAVAQPRADRPEIAQAEAATEDRRVAERRPGRRRESSRPAVDERADRRRHESGRVATEPPLPLELLERSGVAMGARELLDDERHAFGLGVHRGR